MVIADFMASQKHTLVTLAGQPPPETVFLEIELAALVLDYD
jgi:hypothetical protein